MQTEFDSKIAKIKDDLLKVPKWDNRKREQQVQIAMKDGQRQLDESKKEIDLKLRDKMRIVEDARDERVHQMQGQFIALATILPPIPPLVLGILVFFVRRAKETEGVSKKRLL